MKYAQSEKMRMDQIRKMESIIISKAIETPKKESPQPEPKEKVTKLLAALKAINNSSELSPKSEV